jgi:hypothetical protein
VKVKSSRSVSRPQVTTRGARLVSHAGLGMLAEVADMSGLTAGLNAMFVREGCQWRRHPPGVTLIRAAAAIADGMTNLSQVASLCRSRPLMFEQASSLSTLSRTVFTLGNELMTPRLDTVLCDARTRVWAAARFAPEALIIDVDSTLLTNHSDKQWSAATYKGGFGAHPIAMFVDGTSEPLAMILRPGNAGANNAVDHCSVLMRSIDQLPAVYQAGHQHGDNPDLVTHPMLVRADSAGATKEFLGELVARNIEFSVGFPVTERCTTALCAIATGAWKPAVNSDGKPRDHAQVVELTDLKLGDDWPAGRLICRREKPHPGAQLSLFDTIDGRRHTIVFTNTTSADIAGLELRHRQHARVEDRIRCWKATGATHQPGWDGPANEAWLNTTLIAMTLVAWAQLIGFDGPLAKAEPATFRNCVLHVAGQYATSGRNHYLHLDRNWPWATPTVEAYQRIRHAFAVT